MSSVLPPDLMAALGGGGSDQSAPASSSLPPEIAALVGGGGDQGAPADSGSGKDPQAAVQYVSDAIDTLKKYIDVEPDEEDIQVAMTCLQNLQKLKAKDQQEADGAMQGKATPRLMRKVGSAPSA